MYKILVVEDDSNIRNGIANFLKFENYSVQTAENGKIGFEIAKDIVPDLIISDIMMPVMDGYDFLTSIRNHSALSHLPVLFLSAKSESSMIRSGMNLGADDYITKPFSFDELLSAIKTRLSRKETIQDKSQAKLKSIRSNLISLMPHEYYTPLNSILGFSEVLREEYDTLEKSEALEMISSIFSSGKRLQNLIENTLLYFWFTSATKSELDYDIEGEITSNCSEIIQDILHEESLIYERNSDLEINELIDCELSIREDHFAKIHKELIINAIKFSNPGTPITISSKRKDSNYLFTVEDRGRGFSDEQIKHIDEFTQFNRKMYEQQGQGLGLFLTKKLVEIYKGNFHISSLLGMGTTVKITLPISKE
ncbi:MAG: response regulator [Leptospiraceae bacterium]|nr:response regulator [Leptospiraceae bacterium]MCP5512992.1 response regulator [Leptospiraceae bacterium]